MLLPETRDFLEQIMSRVKFPFDKTGIKSELEAHINDKRDFYMEIGHDRVSAEKLAVSDMGDARQIGQELNRQHHPLIGWLWIMTNLIVIAIVLLNLSLVGPKILMSFKSSPINSIPDSRIVYSIDVNETVRLDDTLIKFQKIVLDKSGTMHIAYEHHEKLIFRSGWSLGNIGTIRDDLGNEYFDGSESSSNGIVSKGVRSVDNFNPQANKLIISYDSYNRSYKIEIPLKR